MRQKAEIKNTALCILLSGTEIEQVPESELLLCGNEHLH
jgi:hypothetical protein